jgi:3-hydroxyisobutyrate dehydrogenase-like beta-hydroxyacid dehydrogenase
MTENTTTVGIIGLGKIGMVLARNLLSAGFDVTGISRTQKPDFVSIGGRYADSTQQIGIEADFIVLSLPSADAVKTSVDALCETCHEGQVVIDLTGYSLNLKQAMARKFSDLGVVHLDCEMSGLPFMVANRTATIMQSGPSEAVAKAQGVFDAMVSKQIYLGEFGSASKMKLLHNMMIAIHNSVAAEVVNLAKMSGLDPEVVVETLEPGTAGSAMFSIKAPIMISGDFEEGAGPFRTMAQYLRRAVNWSEEVGASTPLLDATYEFYERAEQEGRGNQDIAAVIELLKATKN